MIVGKVSIYIDPDSNEKLLKKLERRMSITSWKKIKEKISF